MAFEPSKTTQLSGTQAGGAVTAEIPPRFTGGRRYIHTLMAECVNTATGQLAGAAAGTLTVRARLEGMLGYQPVGEVMSLVAPQIYRLEGFYESIQAESAGLDTDKSWRLTITSGEKG